MDTDMNFYCASVLHFIIFMVMTGFAIYTCHKSFSQGNEAERHGGVLAIFFGSVLVAIFTPVDGKGEILNIFSISGWIIYVIGILAATGWIKKITTEVFDNVQLAAMSMYDDDDRLIIHLGILIGLVVIFVGAFFFGFWMALEDFFTIPMGSD